MKLINRISLLFIVLLFGLTFSVNAQSSKQHSKMNSSKHHMEKVALDGYCPVAYYVLNKAKKGNPKYSFTYEGKIYHFASAKAEKMFKKDPKKYLPAYGGYCAFGMSMGKKVSVNPKLFIVYKGKTYLFHNKKVKKMFKKNPAEFVKKDNKEFAKLKK